VNYLLRRIGGKEASSTAAIMDLGGASTQIVFEPTVSALHAEDFEAKEYWYDLPFGDHSFKLYQHSYLGYGLIEARKRVKKAIIGQGFNGTKEVEHPCLFPGYMESLQLSDTTKESVTLVGSSTGMDKCDNLVKSSLFSEANECKKEPCSFDGVYQPTFKQTFKDNDIYIFSYFYDRLEPLQIKETLTLKDVKDGVDKVCNPASNKGLSHLLEKNPDYCIDMVYMYGLLAHGYSIAENRTLKMAKKINGMETGWCLGASIHMLDKVDKCKG
jgi:guanosine-diphosphatase